MAEVVQYKIVAEVELLMKRVERVGCWRSGDKSLMMRIQVLYVARSRYLTLLKKDGVGWLKEGRHKLELIEIGSQLYNDIEKGEVLTIANMRR